MIRRARSSTSVMVMTMVATLLAAVVVLWPAFAYVIPLSVTTGPDPVTVTSYKADLQVERDGTLRAVETITADFPYGRHGIFRYFDVKDPSDSHARLIPRDIKVVQDGSPAKVAYSWERGRRYRVAKIGDPDSTLSVGSHTYVIGYTIKGALAPSSAGSAPGESGSWAADGAGSAFYWNVVAGGWQMSMDKTQARISLPVKAADVRCAFGYQSSGECTVTGTGTTAVVVRTGPLGPRTPVTVRATQDLPAPDRVTLPWTVQYDGVLGQSLPLALVVLLLGVLGFVVGRLWEWTSREAPPGYPVMYEPPAGMSPVQAYFVMHEKMPADALMATLLFQAERGLTSLTQESPKDWVIRGKGGDWSQVDDITRMVGRELGVLEADSSFHANGTVSAGSDLNTVSGKLDAAVKRWAIDAGYLAPKSTETLGRVLVLAAVVLAAVLAFWRPGGITLWAIPFACFFVGGIGLLRGGVGTRRTVAGRDQWSRAGGFYRLLSTPSAQDRFDFSANRALYTAYIPYAVAFSCADKWARKYELATGEQAPIPVWYVGSVGQGGWIGGGSSFASFESSLHSSIGAYEASQSSSSSGGGGFSGGGGGGGGGGGSW